MKEFGFDEICAALRRPISDPMLQTICGNLADKVERSAHLGYLKFSDLGISLVFKEAPWLIPERSAGDEHELHFASCQYHAPGHEGYKGYSGELPNKLRFGLSMDEAVQRFGEPSARGGTLSKLLKKRIEPWVRYDFASYSLHLQFGDRGLELVSLFAPDIPSPK
jgi:hypothetical protein